MLGPHLGLTSFLLAPGFWYQASSSRFWCMRDPDLGVWHQNPDVSPLIYQAGAYHRHILVSVFGSKKVSGYGSPRDPLSLHLWSPHRWLYGPMGRIRALALSPLYFRGEVVMLDQWQFPGLSGDAVSLSVVRELGGMFSWLLYNSLLTE